MRSVDRVPLAAHVVNILGRPRRFQCFLFTCSRGKAKATYMPPVGDFGSLPPPAAMTTYCCPLTSYVAGVALPANGRVNSHRSSPVDLSNARNFLSKLVAPMKMSPPAVTIGPP